MPEDTIIEDTAEACKGETPEREAWKDAPACPATGQETCYDTEGNVIDCASADYPGQDGFDRKGCAKEGRFVDKGDGTVSDTCTGLVWQKDTADVNGDGQIRLEWDGGDRVTWQDPLKYCDSLVFAGRDDWRLPNTRELLLAPSTTGGTIQRSIQCLGRSRIGTGRPLPPRPPAGPATPGSCISRPFRTVLRDSFAAGSQRRHLVTCDLAKG